MSEDNEIKNLFTEHREDLTYQMPDSLRRKIASEFLAPPPRAENSRSWLWAGAGAAASILMVTLSFLLGRLSGGSSAQNELAQDIVSGHVRSLMVNHIYDVASSDRHTVKPWFEGKLDFGPDVRDFAEKDFALVGGRLDYISGRSAAAMIYKHGGHFINVYEWPASDATDADPHFQSQRGFQVFAWRRGGLNYWAVSDLNAADLQRFVEFWL
jgi:anti-sigma factor RsiW